MNASLLAFSITLQNLITQHEGLELRAYFCPAQKLTIGYGHMLLPSDYVLFKDRLPRNWFAELLNRCNTHKRIAKGDAEQLYISKDQAVELLQKDTQQVAEFVRSVVHVPLTQNQFDAVISFVFNVGQGAFSRSTMRLKLNKGDYPGAACEFDKWANATVNGKLTKLPGLVKRRAEELKLFEAV